MKWSITVDGIGWLSRQWERREEGVFTGCVEEVEAEVRFLALGCGWSCGGAPRRVHRLGRLDVVAVTLSEGEFCVTATRLP